MSWCLLFKWDDIPLLYRKCSRACNRKTTKTASLGCGVFLFLFKFKSLCLAFLCLEFSSNSNTVPACLHLTSGQNERYIMKTVFVEAGQQDMHYNCFFTRWSYDHTRLNNETTIWKATHNSFVNKVVFLLPNLYGDIKQVFSHYKAKQTQLTIKLCQVI